MLSMVQMNCFIDLLCFLFILHTTKELHPLYNYRVSTNAIILTIKFFLRLLHQLLIFYSFSLFISLHCATLPHYYINTLLHYSIITLLHYYITALQHYFITTLLHYYITTLLHYYITILLHYSITPLLHYYFTTLLHFYITTLVH